MTGGSFGRKGGRDLVEEFPRSKFGFRMEEFATRHDFLLRALQGVRGQRVHGRGQRAEGERCRTILHERAAFGGCRGFSALTNLPESRR